MSNAAVLVLNQNYEPLNVCNARRAFVLVDRGKAEIIEHSEGALRSALTMLDDLCFAAVDEDECSPGVAHVQRFIVLIQD